MLAVPLGMLSEISQVLVSDQGSWHAEQGHACASLSRPIAAACAKYAAELIHMSDMPV